MLRQFLAPMIQDNFWNLFFLLLFVGSFFGIVVGLFRKGKKQKYDRVAQLPLED